MNRHGLPGSVGVSEYLIVCNGSGKLSIGRPRKGIDHVVLISVALDKNSAVFIGVGTRVATAVEINTAVGPGAPVGVDVFIEKISGVI